MEPSSRNTCAQRKRARKDSQRGEGGLGTTASSHQERNRVRTRSLSRSTSLLVAPSVESRRPSKISHLEQKTNPANCASSGLPPSSPSSTSSLRKSPLSPSTVAQEPLPQTSQIMAKRNTYPTPDSSPKSQAASSSSMPGWSNISPIVPLGYYDGYHDALSPSPLQAENIVYPLNPGFDYGPRLLTAVQSGQFSEYTHPSSESTAATTAAPFPSDVSGDHRVMARHSTGYPQAPTPADTSYSGSPAAPTPSLEGPNSNSRGTSRRKAPAQAGKPDEEDTPIYYCDQCPREFPRPCDLTKHKKTHERPFKCDDESCKYHVEGFPTNKERERHQNDIHAANSKEWKCTYPPCTYKSKRESNCKQHMEKAHGYNYKRMKRNPRKRPEQPTKPLISDKKKRGAIKKTTVATPRSAVSKATKASQSSPPGPSELTALSREDSNVAVSTGFDMYSSYPQPPAMHGVNDYPLMDTGMPYPDGSPTTDFEPSPVAAPMGYNPPLDAYETSHSMIEDSEWYSSQDSGFLETYFFGQSGAPYDEGVGGDNTAD